MPENNIIEPGNLEQQPAGSTLEAVNSTNSTPVPLPQHSRRRRVWIFVITLIVLLAVAGGLLIFFLRHKPVKTKTPSPVTVNKNKSNNTAISVPFEIAEQFFMDHTATIVQNTITSQPDGSLHLTRKLVSNGTVTQNVKEYEDYFKAVNWMYGIDARSTATGTILSAGVTDNYRKAATIIFYDLSSDKTIILISYLVIPRTPAAVKP